MTSTGLAKVSQGKKAAEVKERRVDEMLTRSRERVQIQSQIIQDGDLTRALQLSPEERNEVILKLLFQIKEETSKVEPVRKKVLEIESKVSEVEKSLDHAYERIEETEKNQQHLKNSETLVHELKVKMDEVEKRMEQMEKKEDDLENRDRRINLNFRNFPEKIEGENCASFIRNFVSNHMKVRGLPEHLAIQRAHKFRLSLHRW
ncbi:tropomyosin alpha-4 chain-like [Ptychodera flava]|uniref:tropomyosin alpha-4 chain-like n=1 Tax=Ptychodera flava TaxID=63121 RepID=UPI00396AB003